MKIKRHFLLASLLLLAVIAWQVSYAENAQALPEYSTQTGEPCATCHLSASGGGGRGVRGQAWVGSDKPGAVPPLVESLELLGIRLESDPADFVASPLATPAAPQPLPVQPAKPEAAQDMHNWLRNHDGN